MSSFTEYEQLSQKLGAVKMQIAIRIQEGNMEAAQKLIAKKDRLTAQCDDLYCELFMSKSA